MPSPLSPIEPNVSTPQRSMTSTSLTNSDNDDNSYDNSSSPFMSDSSPQSGHSLPRARPISRIISGGELSPLKIVQQQQTQNVEQQPPPTTTAATEDTPSPAKTMPPPPLPNSPRKMTGAPIKRFPIKVNSAPAVNGSATRNANETPRAYERRISLHDTIQENPGLKHAIEIFEDDESMLDIEPSSHTSNNNNNNTDDTLSMSSEQAGSNQGHAHVYHEEGPNSADDEAAGADDTMISTYSTFSAVPNMTMFAQMRSNSPSKFSLLGGATHRAASGQVDPSPSRTPHAAGSGPDRSAQYDSGGSTTNLLDFTEQVRFGGYPQQTPSRDRHISPSHTSQGNATIGATPQRSSIANLLDFDIPPMPTPRSIPTITPRELESLKSNFLSEISSLKASLSGKEAEVMSLKTAVGDAEKRVGECMEHLRDLRGEHEHLVTDRDSWEKRGREMESVLRKVKEEIVLGQREREELEFKLDEAEKRREAAEMMAQDAESKMAGMRAGKASAEAAAAAAGSGSDSGKSPNGVAASNKEVEMAVERVARELHALYKSKHEVKVAALKKSYEGRWEKKVRELQNQVDELARENEEVRRGRDVTTTKVDLARLTELEEERKKEKAQDTTHIKELEAELEKLEAMLRTVQGDNAELRVLLERERVEKGELVMLAEEMMNMQQQQTLIAAEQQQQRQHQEYERQQQHQRQQHEYERQQQQRQHEFERQQHQSQRDDRMSSSGNGYSNSNGSGNGHSNNNSNNRPSRSSSSSSSVTLNNEGPSAAPAPAPMSLGNKTPGRRNTAAPPSRGTPLTAKRQSQQISSNNGETPAMGVSNFRNSISAGGRPSSLRAPGGISGLAKPTESRIGRMGVAGHERNKSHGMGLPRPGSGLGMNGGASRGIMSSIEKMGTSGRGYGRD